jgi:hypothetical protein
MDNKSTKKNLLSKISIKHIHIALIVLGAIFAILPCFHTNIWFDESYSLSISKHSFGEIWSIGAYDVHPVLYYWMLKIVRLLTNDSIMAIKIFSWVPLVIMGILGYTHIRKDFGEKTGLFFSFFAMLLPTCLIYSCEARMYSWAMLFVTIMFIYCYRILKSDKASNKNWIIFSIFSLASAYIHYYGLISAFVINLGMFIYFAVKSKKNKGTDNRLYWQNFIRNIISAIVQVALYMPWLGVFLSQAKTVSGGYWIGVPNVPEIIEFQFTGNLGDTIHIPKFISWPFTILFIMYLIYTFKKNWNKEEIKPAKFALFTYGAIVITLCLITIIERILYARYFLNMTGIFVFMIAVLFAMDNSKKAKILCVLTVILSLIANISLICDNYDPSNAKPDEYILEDMQESDTFLSDNSCNGVVLSSELNVPNDKLYFLNSANWNVDEAYKAYGTVIHDLSEIKDFKGRIWAIESSDQYGFQKEILEKIPGAKVIKSEHFYRRYQHYQFSISLIEVE